MSEKKQFTGWAKRNRFERICLIIAIIIIAALGIVGRLNPLFMFHWALYPLLAAFFILALLSTWRHIVPYERVCFIALAAAAITSAVSLRFVFLTPSGFGFPLWTVSVGIVLLMMGVLFWRKSRIEGILFLVLGGGFLLWNIGKMIYKLVTQSP